MIDIRSSDNATNIAEDYGIINSNNLNKFKSSNCRNEINIKVTPAISESKKTEKSKGGVSSKPHIRFAAPAHL